MAELGEWFFQAVIGTQLTLVLLAAPAATAGAICIDRARGTLTHMLMTDLADFEIVLGKLAARLVPVVGLVACTLPMMELLILFGGVAPEAVWGAFVVTLGVALARLFAWPAVLALAGQNPRGASGHVRSVVSLAAGPSLAANGRDDNGLVRAASATLDQPILSCFEPIVPRHGHVESRSRISGRELGHLGALDRLGDPPPAPGLHARSPSRDRGPDMPGHGRD